jgi:hypothetical protein
MIYYIRKIKRKIRYLFRDLKRIWRNRGTEEQKNQRDIERKSKALNKYLKNYRNSIKDVARADRPAHIA